MGSLQPGLEVAFYLYPVGLFVTLFSTQILSYRYRKAPKALASIILVLRNAITSRDKTDGNEGFPYSAYLSSHTGVLLYFLAGLLPDPDGPWSPTVPHGYAWVVGLMVDVVINSVLFSEHELIPLPDSLIDALFSLGISRVVVLGLMGALLVRRQRLLRPERGSLPEGRSLLENGDGPANGYGGTNGHAAMGPAKMGRNAQSSGWPYDAPLHQATVIVCVILLILQRLVQVAVPVVLGWLVEALGYGTIPYKEIVLYIIFRSLQGGQGLIGAARAVLWIPVSQGLFRRLSCAAFEHVLGLSMDFHLSKRIGEVTSALSRGAAMNTFLETFLFSVFPMLFDIFVAGIYLFFMYDAFYTLIVFIIMWTYIFLTMYMAKWRGRQRREMATKAREMDAAKTDAILAYETVQHNCAVRAETDRFRNQVTVYQRAERLVQLSLNFLNVTQNSVFTLGTALIVVVSAYKISIGQQKVSDFVTLITYFAQLQAPLNFFGTYYTMLQNNLIEAERMLDLFKETSGVIEKPDASDLDFTEGEIEFRDVRFSYQGKEPALDGVSFTVAPGTKTALVGESGSGKSTCLKLLYRFYDVNTGSVRFDDQDIRDLKLDSVRKHIGVVPQDTVLFNASIMYNLKYANPNATEADVFEAAKAANIHDRILAFPEKYDTEVGERGLKLSGGERQRIAIARAILKDARVLLLDEATASLDSHTERQIQEALERVTAGRTTITIAHRLSTITTSDQILVLHKGKIVERGTHSELLASKGSYFAMWEKQTTTEKKAAEAEADKEGKESDE
ncbi:putative heavy metal tolerance protein [Eutypa lata UCREL1]|uniref:Putative heavy metal tolerance protein n=1 Tax=Eutypa lata (strain UCR-EL1) TaxID=1287681 RepID=M7T427_EUTLA|nr:putative heavy metal tolerance protein [Eutypa lata UCREL1]